MQTLRSPCLPTCFMNAMLFSLGLAGFHRHCACFLCLGLCYHGIQKLCEPVVDFTYLLQFGGTECAACAG